MELKFEINIDGSVTLKMTGIDYSIINMVAGHLRKDPRSIFVGIAEKSPDVDEVELRLRTAPGISAKAMLIESVVNQIELVQRFRDALPPKME